MEVGKVLSNLFLGVIILLGISSISSCSPKLHSGTGKEKQKQELIAEKDLLRYKFLLAEATNKKLLGEIDQAILLYREALKINPSSDAALFELSNIYQYLGENELAIQYAEDAYDIDKNNIWYGRHLAGLYHLSGKNERTIQLYEEMKDKFPENIELRYNLASLYQEQERSFKAIDLLDEIEKETGISERVNMSKFNIYEKEKKYKQAIDELLKLVKAYPDNVQFIGILAETYDEQGKFMDAEQTYEILLKQHPENGLAQMSVTSFYRRQENYDKSLEWLMKAVNNPEVGVSEMIQETLFYLGQPEIFEKYQSEIADVIQKMADNHPEDVKVIALLADYMVRSGKYAEAAGFMQEVNRLAPELFSVWEQRVFIENTLGNLENVENICGEAIQHFPDSVQLYLYKAIAEYQLGKNNQLIETAEEGARIAGENKRMKKEFFSLQAEAFHALGMTLESDGMFEEVLKLDPDDVTALNNYAYYLALRGERLEYALEMSGKTLQVDPGNPTYLDTYAWILYMLKDYNEALKYITESVNQGGMNDPDILEHYGDILIKIGDREKAVEMWKKSVELGNRREDIKVKIREEKY